MVEVLLVRVREITVKKQNLLVFVNVLVEISASECKLKCGKLFAVLI